MKKLLLTIILILACATAFADPPPTPNQWIHDPVNNIMYPAFPGAGIGSLPAGGGPVVSCNYNGTTGLYECDMGFDIPSLTLTPQYGSAALFYVPNSTRIAPHASGTGMLQYNGTLLTKYTAGSTYYLKKTVDDSAYGTYLKQNWYCTTTPANPYTLDAADWASLAASGTGTLSNVLAADSTECSTLRSTYTITGNSEYKLVNVVATLDTAKTQRLIARVKFGTSTLNGLHNTTLGSNINGVGFLSNDMADYIVVGVSGTTGGSLFNGNYATVFTANGATSLLNEYLTTTTINDDYHDVEIYVSGTNFTVKIDGTQVATQASTSTVRYVTISSGSGTKPTGSGAGTITKGGTTARTLYSIPGTAGNWTGGVATGTLYVDSQVGDFTAGTVTFENSATATIAGNSSTRALVTRALSAWSSPKAGFMFVGPVASGAASSSTIDIKQFDVIEQ